MVENGLSLKRKARTMSSRILSLILRLFRGKFAFDRFKPDVYLTDGQNLEEYGFKAKVIHIPGHTKGSVGILTDDGDLFAGDTFINKRKPAKKHINAAASSAGASRYSTPAACRRARRHEDRGQTIVPPVL